MDGSGESMKKAASFLPAVGYYGLIFYLSSRSSFPVWAPFSGFDKLVHGAEFAGLGLLLTLGFAKIVRRPARWIVFYSLATGILLGLSDEFHQAFVPLRTPDLGDAAADAAGVALGVCLFFILGRWAKKKKAGPKPYDSG
jgi:hypothetical protein